MQVVLFHDGMHGQVDVLLSGGDIVVPHNSLQAKGIAAIGNEIHAQGMSQTVRAAFWAGYAGLLHAAPNNLVYGEPGYGLPVLVREEKGLRAVGIVYQWLEQMIGVRTQRDPDLLIAFPPDADRVATNVEDAQAAKFAGPDARVQRQGEDGPVAGIAGPGQYQGEVLQLKGPHLYMRHSGPLDPLHDVRSVVLEVVPSEEGPPDSPAGVPGP